MNKKKIKGSAQKDNQVAPDITSRAIHENEQTLFRRFVISAFNEDYFKIHNDSEQKIDLVLRVEPPDHSPMKLFGILYHFEPMLDLNTAIVLPSTKRLIKHKQFYHLDNKDTFLVIGANGNPSDPAHLFCLHIREVSDENLPLSLLEKYYKKNRTFFYDPIKRIIK